MKRNTCRGIGFAGMFVLLLSQTGCIILWETEPRFIRDPQARDYRKVVAVERHKITLEDGRTVEIGGVDQAKASDQMCRAYQKQIDALVGQYALVLSQAKGKAHVVSRAEADPPPLPAQRSKSFERLALVLFTIHEDVPPPRDDIGLNFVSGGNGEAKLDELGDSQGRSQYRAAQAEAQKRHDGIWEFAHWSRDVQQEMYVAFLQNDLERARYLLERSPGRPKPTELNGILCLTVGIANVPGVEMLLDHGADVNGADPDGGNLPLMMAISHSTGNMPIPGDTAMVKTLLKHGANANGGYTDGPVQVTVALDNNKTERVWLRREAATPLMVAASGGNIEIVKMLLDAGADATVRTKPSDSAPKGKTALEMAKEKIIDGPQWRDIVDLFQRRGIAN